MIMDAQERIAAAHARAVALAETRGMVIDELRVRIESDNKKLNEIVYSASEDRYALRRERDEARAEVKRLRVSVESQAQLAVKNGEYWVKMAARCGRAEQANAELTRSALAQEPGP